MFPGYWYGGHYGFILLRRKNTKKLGLMADYVWLISRRRASRSTRQQAERAWPQLHNKKNNDAWESEPVTLRTNTWKTKKALRTAAVVPTTKSRVQLRKDGLSFYCRRESAPLLADIVNIDDMLSLPHDDPRLGRNSVHTVEVMGRITRTKVRARAGRASAFACLGAAQVVWLHRGAHLAREAYRGMLVEGCYDHVS